MRLTHLFICCHQDFSVTAIKKLVLPKVLGIVSVNSSPREREKFLKEWNKSEKHD